MFERYCLHCGRLMMTQAKGHARYCSRDCWLRSAEHREQQSARMLARYVYPEDASLTKPPGDPTPEQILTLAAAVRSTWTEDEFRERTNAPRHPYAPTVYPAHPLSRTND